MWGWSKHGKGLVCFLLLFFRELPHFSSNALTESSQQVEAEKQHVHITSLLLCRKEGSSESHTKRPHIHIGLSDLLRRPGQWCFKSSTTVGSLLSPNCRDRIGSEMCVGLKIGLLFWHELNNLVLYASLKTEREQRSHFMRHFGQLLVSLIRSMYWILYTEYLHLTLLCCNTLILHWDCLCCEGKHKQPHCFYFLTRIVRALLQWSLQL